MTKEESIADEINKTLNLNLYENSRRLELVDARSIYCYILHKELNYTLYKVRDSLRAKGKNYDHASVIHSVKIFDEVKKRRKDIEELRNSILGRSSIKAELIQKIKSIDNEEELIEINNCINSKDE
jgi:chromosomal replication initiation ATPase DnaA